MSFRGNVIRKLGLLINHKSLSTIFVPAEAMLFLAVDGVYPRSNSLKQLQNYGLKGSFPFLGPGATWPGATVDG